MRIEGTKLRESGSAFALCFSALVLAVELASCGSATLQTANGGAGGSAGSGNSGGTGGVGGRADWSEEAEEPVRQRAREALPERAEREALPARPAQATAAGRVARCHLGTEAPIPPTPLVTLRRPSSASMESTTTVMAWSTARTQRAPRSRCAFPWALHSR